MRCENCFLLKDSSTVGVHPEAMYTYITHKVTSTGHKSNICTEMHDEESISLLDK